MEKKEKEVKREMVEKTSDKFLGKTTKFLGFKREKNVFFFTRFPL